MMRLNPYAKGTDQHRAWQRGYTACQIEWMEAVKRRSTKPSRWRSSILGRFVTKAFAKDNPDTTEGER